MKFKRHIDWCMCDHKIKPGGFIPVDKFNPLTCAVCHKELPFGVINAGSNDRIFDKTHVQYIKWWHRLLLPFCKSYKSINDNYYVVTKRLFGKMFVVDSRYFLPKRIRNDKKGRENGTI